LPGLTVENVLETGVTWEGDFRCFLGSHKIIVWITPDVYVYSQGFYDGDDPSVLMLRRFHGINMLVHVRSGTDAAEATVTCDFLVRLLAPCEKHDIYIRGNNDEASTPLSGAALSLFFPREPQLSYSPSHFGVNDLELRPVSCTSDHVTT
jgi:hypothetical protein